MSSIDEPSGENVDPVHEARVRMLAAAKWMEHVASGACGQGEGVTAALGLISQAEFWLLKLS